MSTNICHTPVKLLLALSIALSSWPGAVFASAPISASAAQAVTAVEEVQQTPCHGGVKHQAQIEATEQSLCAKGCCPDGGCSAMSCSFAGVSALSGRGHNLVIATGLEPHSIAEIQIASSPMLGLPLRPPIS